MRALLLAAGFGTRLRPLTDTIPKCLVPIQGKPLLGIWLERLHRVGIDRFGVNTHHLAGQVRDFVEAGPYRNQVTLMPEPSLLGTAATLLKNMDFFQGNDGLLIHADNYCLADFGAFIQAHHQRPPECLMTLMAFHTHSPSTCGILQCDDRGVVVDFHEKVANPPGNLANGAVYLLSPEFLQLARKRFFGATDFSTEILPALMGRIYTYTTHEVFIDIGTPQSYAEANQSEDPGYT
jgi:mannose-1-phosphate guanylyltransferase